MDTSKLYALKKVELQKKCKDFKLSFEEKETKNDLIQKLENYLVSRGLAEKANEEQIKESLSQNTNIEDTEDFSVTDKTGDDILNKSKEISEKPFVVENNDTTIVIEPQNSNPKLIMQPVTKTLMLLREECGRNGIAWFDHETIQNLLDKISDFKVKRGITGTPTNVNEDALGGMKHLGIDGLSENDNNKNLVKPANLADMGQVLNQKSQFNNSTTEPIKVQIKANPTVSSISENDVKAYGKSFVNDILKHFRPMTINEIKKHITKANYPFSITVKELQEEGKAYLVLTADCGSFRFPENDGFKIRA